MNLSKQLPLTETTFFILLALREAAHGYAVMQQVEQLSGGRVRIAAGTMYGALENLQKQKLIEAAPSQDPRRKNYRTTAAGRALLELEHQRLRALADLYERQTQGDKPEEEEA